jgi:serine/threonine protein kinase
MIGTRLGPYEVIAPIGAGGMGEVYRARDTRLGRDVALGVGPLAPVASNDSEDGRAKNRRVERVKR